MTRHETWLGFMAFLNGFAILWLIAGILVVLPWMVKLPAILFLTSFAGYVIGGGYNE